MSISVVSRVTQENSPSFAFSHPIQPDWADKEIPEIAIESLDERFRNNSVHPGTVIGALIRVTNFVTKRRSDLEKKHSELTFVSGDAYNRYVEMAGNPSLALDFVEHFSRSATESLRTNKHGSDRSINLGGNRQYGFMNATETTDRMSTQLTTRLLERYGDKRVHPYNKGEHDLLRYAFEYYIPASGVSVDNKPQFGIVTRRRPVVDHDKVRVFKESVGLIVLANLSKDIFERISSEVGHQFEIQSVISRLEISKSRAGHQYEKPFSEHDETLLRELKHKSSHAFPTAGRIFEDAIATHDDFSTDVVPVSAHYIMRMKRSDVVQ